MTEEIQKKAFWRADLVYTLVLFIVACCCVAWRRRAGQGTGYEIKRSLPACLQMRCPLPPHSLTPPFTSTHRAE